MLDIGETGRHSDGGVLSHSLFGKALETNTLSIPRSSPLKGSEFFCIIGIENTAFIFMNKITSCRCLCDSWRCGLSRVRRINGQHTTTTFNIDSPSLIKYIACTIFRINKISEDSIVRKKIMQSNRCACLYIKLGLFWLCYYWSPQNTPSSC